MAQHLREGSVIHYGSVPGGTATYENAVVTNITGMYIEFEWTDPATSTSYVLVRPWNPNGHITVVVD